MESRVQKDIGGRTLSIESGKVARQASGAVLVQYGEAMVLTAVVSPEEKREGVSFLPLTVDYRERLTAAGRFPGGYFKREGRPTEKEVLTMRLTDRPIRPLFPEGYTHELQVMSTVLSADGVNDPDIVSIIGASAALTVSDIPFSGPVGAVRIGLVGEELIVNPTIDQMEESRLNLVLAGTEASVVMVEGNAAELPEEKMIEALRLGHGAVKEIVALQNELRELCGKPKREFEPAVVPPEAVEAVEAAVDRDALRHALTSISGKKARDLAIRELREAICAKILEGAPEGAPAGEPEGDPLPYKKAFRKLVKDTMRTLVLEEGIRSDGRRTDEIRPISCDLGLLPRTHGSALFTRGETQALVVTTLGSCSDRQRIDTLEGETAKHFMIHYNFPPFCTGEARRIGSPKRREIGHGHLAEMALQAVMPEDYPYTVRLVSDILESNGSSSMATVCGGSLAMMDAGIPVKSAVAGIAMGLIQEGDRVAVISDILGSEDAMGDMDFKVAGTREGITAFQLDLKARSVPLETLHAALAQAREGRLHILDRMAESISRPRESLSRYAPRITVIQIPPTKIGTLIGPGGRMIKRICEEHGVDVDVEDDGRVYVSTNDDKKIKAASDFIRGLTAEAEVGKIYTGKVKTVTAFGAFVEILPGKDGMIHISDLADHRVKRVEDIVDVGDEVAVKVIAVDNRGRINLSRRAALAGKEGVEEGEANSGPRRPPRKERGGKPPRRRS